MVATSIVTFVMVPVVYQALYGHQSTLSNSATTIIQCASSCLMNRDCGGYSWDKTKSPPCRLIIWTPTSPGNGDITGKVHRLQQFQGRKLTEQLSTVSFTMKEAFDLCLEVNAVPVPPPMTKKDKSVLEIRSDTTIPVGITRQDTSSYLFYDYAGKEYDLLNPNYSWYMGEPSNVIGETHVFMYTDKLVDAPDSYSLVNSGLLCVEKEI